MNRLLTLIPLIASAFAAPVPIFDGKTLEGWDYDPKVWRVEDGMITGGSTTEKITANYFICTKRSFQNFELTLKIKCSGDPKTGMINSGIQVRSVRVPGGHHMSGYQIDCGAGWFGKIYDEFRRNRVIATPVDQAALDKVVDVFGWNEYRIRAEGPRIQTWINGVLAIDYTETDPNIALDGQIGPQVHSGGVALVQVKDVTIEELPPTPGAPTWESLGGVDEARKKVAPPPKGADAAKPKRDISYNAVQGTPKTAQEQQKLFHLPDGYEIELVVQESDAIGKFVSVYFDQRGRMWTQTALEYPVDGNENPAAADALYASRAKDKVLVFPREALNAPLPPGGLTNPTVFADGLAIPLGILPWGNGDACYIQHGPDLKLFKDTNGDGRADTSEVILTGFGVQDSHLFPHQFTRAPGGWIWMAQGLFNNSKPHRPGDERAVDWPKCSMAKMRPDGSAFEVTSVGPNNIWGLVLTAEGEAFIQEANDYGYPVMPFHEYAYYPGGMEALRKSYQPEFPPQADFRMGGTGLSGLALGEGAFRRLTPSVKPDGLCMIVANPIISKVQTLAMHRDGPYWKLEQAPDLIICDDPFFRPVALTNGPDGCIYIVDWYNKIISHNEVPRAHPDRDKTRGRIWRVKATAGEPFPVRDLTKARPAVLLTKLGGPSLTQSHLAWQMLVDHFNSPAGSKEADLQRFAEREQMRENLIQIALTRSESPARRVQALWVLSEIGDGLITKEPFQKLMADEDRNVRREALRALIAVTEYGSLDGRLGAHQEIKLAARKAETDPEVRAEAIQVLGTILNRSTSLPRHNAEPDDVFGSMKALLAFAREPLAQPTAQSTRNGKPIKVREAYDREFERYLVRMFLEQQPDAVAKFLDADATRAGAVGQQPLPVEARLLASLALEPKASAARVAKLLPQLQRAPGQEEVLRLAQFPDEPGVGEALRAALNNPATRTGVLESLLATRTKLDAAKLTPFLADAAKQLLAASDDASVQLGVQLAGGFQLAAAEPQLVKLATASNLAALRALRDLGSAQSELFARLATSKDAQLRDEAVLALASSKAPDASERLLKLWPDLAPALRRNALDRLASTKPGAKTIVSAIRGGTMKKDDLDGPTVEKLQAVLGNDKELAALLGELASLFRPVLALDGSDEAWTETGLTLDGPFTVECWVRLDPALAKRNAITNQDGILGAPGQLDMNFFGGKFRVWVGHDVAVSSKATTPGLWTHVAASRDAAGVFRLYQDGELTATGTQSAPQEFANVRIAWTGPKGGTAGALSEFRIWKGARTAADIRRDFDRTFDAKPDALVFTGWGKVHAGAKVARTSDFPPVMSASEAAALDAKFAKFRALADKPGDVARGKATAALCQACHLFKGQGGAIGPDLSGVGSMGTEAILRNLLTPNAAMEAGYRIFRVELRSGDLVDAFFVSEDKDAVVLRQPGAPDRRIAKKDIARTQYLRRSLMPEGLLDGFASEQVSDLFAFLKTMR